MLFWYFFCLTTSHALISTFRRLTLKPRLKSRNTYIYTHIITNQSPQNHSTNQFSHNQIKMGAQSVQPSIILVPFPAQGHITPMLHLAHAIQSHGFTARLAIPDFIHRRITENIGPTNLSVEFLSIPTGNDRDPKDFISIVGIMENYVPGRFEEMLMSCRVDCVIVDLLASWAIPVAERCGLDVLGFWPAMSASYRIISAIPRLVQKGVISDCGTPIHDQDLPFITELQLPCKLTKLSTKHLPWIVGGLASTKSRFAFWLRILDRTRNLKFILINSFPGDEGQKIDPHFTKPLLTKNNSQVLQIGPLLNCTDPKSMNPTMWNADSTCMDWLDSQASKSVIYVSFGSWVGPIGPEMINELALGLEKSKRPFLWVLKKEKEWQCGLPNGFLDRISGVGKIVEWAPQEEVLEHESIGCYITHCGWNSTLEAIKHAKRLLCYPISGDQFINSSYIVKVWGIGIELTRIDRNEVCDCIEKVIEGREGEEMEKRVIELRRHVMEGKASERAKRNLELFVDSIRRLASNY
ncbi:hypothetical protein LUZ60_016544 [Juncus effusus]|nr:hypothetical protein LUZ60_016544 [Juncus effusus]